MSKIEIRKLSITSIGTEAIVNAANEGLWACSGVCGAIFEAAGLSALTQACNTIGHCDTGSAVITPGFKLCKYIIHAVGPRWGSDHTLEKKQLYACYQAALKLAVENGCKSIGFPLISSGIFGVPVDVAWRKALQACTEFEGDIKIVFAILNDDILAIGQKTLTEMTTSVQAELVQPVDPEMIVFHDTDKEFGFLSNWYQSEFFADRICFSSVEQYLMYQKAVRFNDAAMAEAILKANDPAQVKAYGRQVHNFNETVWNGCRSIILYRALLCKFSQNVELRKHLLETGDKILVEGTACDVIFANGLKRTDPNQYDMSMWKGQNLLGFALMEVRRELAVSLSFH